MAKEFRDFKIRGRRYGFSHLVPMTIGGLTASSPDSKVSTLVSFTSHCWSVGFDHAVHTPDLGFFDEHQRKRAFDLERYEASLELPDIMSDAWKGAVARTRRKNFVMSRGLGGRRYNVFFALMASKHPRFDAHCLVQSTYFREESLGPHLKHMRLHEAVAETVSNGASFLDRDAQGWRFPKRHRGRKVHAERTDHEMFEDCMTFG